MKIVIWGTGIWGKRMHQCLKKNSKYDIVAFIDSSMALQGKRIYDLPIISYDQCKKAYSDCLIVVCIASKQARDAIQEKLINEKEISYFFQIDCPSEMIFLRADGIPFDEMIEESNIVCRNIAIYGNNLFSVLLYDYLAERGNNVCLVYEEVNNNYRFLIKAGYICFEISELPQTIEIILHTEEGWNYKTDNKIRNINQIQFRDFSFLRRYRNSKISEFKNKYANRKRCFIVASGPSLRFEDLETLHKNNEFCFSMNRVYLAFEKSNWRPDVFVVADGKGLMDNSKDLLELDVPVKFYSDASEEFWEINKKEIIERNDIIRYHWTGNYYEGYEPKFSTDLTQGTYLGGTVVYDCLQLAVYMGFKSIYLLGVDFEFKKTGNEDKNHFIKGYAKTAKQAYFYEGIQWQQCAYEKAKKYADSHGIKIYNATRGGKLEVFERVDFDTLFD